MFTLDPLLSHALVSALGWTLVHFLWQGCVIALVYWLICALSPRHAATLRYWAGLAGMLLSLCTVVLTFLLSYAPEARFDLEPVSAAVNPFLVLSGSLPDTWVILETGIEPALPWVVLLWLLGVLVFSARTLREWLGVRRLLREGVFGTELCLQVALEKLKTSLDVQLPVRLLASARVTVPLAIGWLQPVILLPLSVLARLPQDQLEMILAHELGHIRRGDYLFNLLQVVLETLLFYHPAIGWMSRRVREDREHRCDELVVRVCGKPATYARALANLEALRAPPIAAAIPATGGNLLARIHLIINNEIPAKGSVFMQFALVAIAGLFVALGAQQGYSLSTELNRIAVNAQLQASDVQWKTWGRSREVWGMGVNEYAQLSRKEYLAAVKQESLETPQPPEPKVRVSAHPQQTAGVFGQLMSRAETDGPRLSIESFIEAAEVFPGLVMQPHTELDLNSLGRAPLENAALELAGGNASQPAPVPVADAKPGEILNPADDDVTAGLTPLKARPPNYPWQARRKGIEGFVKLEFSVDEEGRVKDVEILDAMPQGVFEKAASRAISKWTFEEADQSAGRYRQVFDFELKDIERGPPRSRPCVLTGTRTCGIVSPGVFVVWVNETTRHTENTGVE